MTNLSKELRLTRAQEEIRLRGLRILARMIVRAHLASLRESANGRSRAGESDGISEDGRSRPLISEAELPWMDDEHGR